MVSRLSDSWLQGAFSKMLQAKSERDACEEAVAHAEKVAKQAHASNSPHYCVHHRHRVASDGLWSTADSGFGAAFRPACEQSVKLSKRKRQRKPAQNTATAMVVLHAVVITEEEEEEEETMGMGMVVALAWAAATEAWAAAKEAEWVEYHQRFGSPRNFDRAFAALADAR